MGPWDDGNESNELVDNPSEDDLDVDEDALANDMTLGNIRTIVAPTPYAVCPPLDEMWRTTPGGLGLVILLTPKEGSWRRV